MHIAFALLALLAITVSERLCTTSTGGFAQPIQAHTNYHRFACPSPSIVAKQCSWTPRLQWEQELITPRSLSPQLLQYHQLRTTLHLPMDCVVVEAEAAWDCGCCCGEAAVAGFNENSKPLRGLEFLAARSICTCYTVDEHLWL